MKIFPQIWNNPRKLCKNLYCVNLTVTILVLASMDFCQISTRQFRPVIINHRYIRCFRKMLAHNPTFFLSFPFYCC